MIFRKLEENEIVEIYHSRMPHDFAPGEIKPLSRILELCKLNKYFCYGLFEGKEREAFPIGYCFLVTSNQKDAVLLDYFAVADKERGKGYGSKCFSMLKNEIQKEKLGTLILEVENPRFGEDAQDISLRRRRIDFYRRNGMTLTHLRIFLYDVEYLVMTVNAQELFQSAEQIYHVYEVLLKPDKIKTKLKITTNIRCIVMDTDEIMMDESVRKKLEKLENTGIHVIYEEKLKRDLTNEKEDKAGNKTGNKTEKKAQNKNGDEAWLQFLQKIDINPEECIVLGGLRHCLFCKKHCKLCNKYA